jgi:hypothetical protein
MTFTLIIIWIKSKCSAINNVMLKITTKFLNKFDMSRIRGSPPLEGLEVVTKPYTAQGIKERSHYFLLDP